MSSDPPLKPAPPRAPALVVGLALLVGLGLRLYGLRAQVFVNPDEALWSYFVVNNAQLPWLSSSLTHCTLGRVLSWDYGWPLFLAYDLYVRLLTGLGIGITELTMRLPQVAIGLLAAVLVWRLGCRTVGPRAALLALFLFLVLPFGVAWSRTFGGSMMANSLLLIVAILGWLRYVERPAERGRQWLAGLGLGLYLCGDVQFVIGGAVLAALILLAPRAEGYEGWAGLGRLVRPGVVVPPVVMFLPYVAAWVYACRLGYPDQTYLGTVLCEHKAVWGLHVGPFLRDLWHNLGLYMLLGLVMVPAALAHPERPRLMRWLLVWAGLTAAPFLFAITSDVTQAHGYHNHLVVALTLLLAYALSHLQRRVTRVLAVLVICLGTLLTTVGAVYNVAPVRAVLWPFDEAPYGGLVPNHGLKTAGYWVRQHLAATDKVFLAHDPAVGFWYLGRDPVLGGYAGHEAQAESWRAAAGKVQAAVITRGTARYPEALFRAAGFPGTVAIETDGTEVARVYTRTPGCVHLDTTATDRLFNATYHTPAALIPPGSPYVPGKPAPGE